MDKGCIGSFGVPDKTELAEINKFTRRNFSADEVYAFSVVLCDNEVDRDFERFSDESLEKLSLMFYGKTGIFDHSHKTENQCARIFHCNVETVEGKTNSLGEPYKKLFARAYMPKSNRTEELILEIDAGIKKEVSVGCSMGRSVCSVCGESFGKCNHQKGKYYKVSGVKTLCYYNLLDPKDAYEWSFVAVPAQRQAGVVKNYTTEEIDIDGILKSAEKGKVTLTAAEAHRLSENLKELKRQAYNAGQFLKAKRLEIVKKIAPDCTDSASLILNDLLDSLEPTELFKLYRETVENEQPAVPQLMKKTKNSKNNKTQNDSFLI
jgi:hypothetical protein